MVFLHQLLLLEETAKEIGVFSTLSREGEEEEEEEEVA